MTKMKKISQITQVFDSKKQGNQVQRRSCQAFQKGDSKEKTKALEFIYNQLLSAYTSSTLNPAIFPPLHLIYSFDELNNSFLSRLDTNKLATSPPEIMEQFLQRAEIFSLEKIRQLIKALFDKRRESSKTYQVPSEGLLLFN